MFNVSPFPKLNRYNSENFRGPMYSGTARKGFSLRDKHGNVIEVPKLYDQCLQASSACRKFGLNRNCFTFCRC